MPRIERILRTLDTLRRLPAPVTAQALADEMEVTPRTIYRDIDTLRGMGVMIDGAAGFGFTLIEDNTLPPLMFDDEEIEALVLGLREVTQVGDPVLVNAAESALRKLHTRLPDRQAHRLQHAVLSARHCCRLATPMIDVVALRRAAWDEQVVQIDYADEQGRETTRSLCPLSIVFMRQAQCLLAFCHLRNNYRVFRLDRIRSLHITDQSFRPRRVPMLREHLAILRGQITAP